MFNIGDEIQIKMDYWKKLRKKDSCMPEFKDSRYIGKIIKINTPKSDTDYVVLHPTGKEVNWSKEYVERVLEKNEL